MSDIAKLELDGKVYELPIIEGTEGEKAIDIRSLRATTGHITIDNGFMNTGSCESKITFLNGEKGVLRYRGYPIEQLAEHSKFVEVSYLLNHGNLPTQSELDNFNNKLSQFTELPEGICNIVDQFPLNAHPMGVISAAVSALSAFYPKYLSPTISDGDKNEAIAQLMAQVKTMMAYFYRRTVGEKPVASRSELGYTKDFLNMMFSNESTDVDDEVAKALDILLILHADHEQNCSASTVRVVGSSHANVFTCVSAGIDALWGQLHGGANQAVLEMLEEIKNNGGDYKKYLDKAKDKSDSFKLMGFGHRVYKNFDPRAKIIKVACDIILKKLNVQDPLLDIAKGLEEEALKDEYFVQRNLYPNVDFYSGIIYKALGIPTNMFTAMFVLGRLPGWLSQWGELRADATSKIARPRQIYQGENEREFIPISNRS